MNDFSTVAVAALALLGLLAAGGLTFAALDLAVGAALLGAFHRKRPLFAALPALNVGVYSLASYAGLAELDFGETLNRALAAVTLPIVAVPLLGLCGLVVAALLVPLQLLLFREPATTSIALADELLSEPRAETLVAAFRQGFAAPWHGLRYLCRNRSLWRYAAIPVVLNLLITAGMLYLLLLGAVAFAAYLHPRFADDWLGVTAEIVFAIALTAAAIGLTAVLWVFLQEVLTGHYYGLLARAMELQLGMPAGLVKDVPWRYQLLDAFRDAAFLILANAALALLHCIPGIGTLIGTLGSWYWNARLFGRDYIDFPLTLRGMKREEKLAIYHRHRIQVLGLGTAVTVCMLIPVVGSVLLAAAAAGAVLLYRQLEPERSAGILIEPA